MNFKNIKNIFFIGDSPIIENLCEVNRNNKIKSFYVASKFIKKKFPKFIKVKKVLKLENEFKNFIKSNVKIEETLFFSINCRWIFNNEIIIFCKNRLINMHSTRLPLDKSRP